MIAFIIICLIIPVKNNFHYLWYFGGKKLLGTYFKVSFLNFLITSKFEAKSSFLILFYSWQEFHKVETDSAQH